MTMTMMMLMMVTVMRKAATWINATGGLLITNIIRGKLQANHWSYSPAVDLISSHISRMKCCLLLKSSAFPLLPIEESSRGCFLMTKASRGPKSCFRSESLFDSAEDLELGRKVPSSSCTFGNSDKATLGILMVLYSMFRRLEPSKSSRTENLSQPLPEKKVGHLQMFPSTQIPPF